MSEQAQRESARAAPTSARAPRRSQLHLVAAVAAAVCILIIVGVSARPALTPALVVQVTPVVAEVDSPSQSASGAARGVTVQGPGWVEPEPYAIACSALADGVVAEILSLEGDRIDAGQVVAKLVDADARLALAGADAEVASAEAALIAARAEREAAKLDWENPTERTRVLTSARARLDEVSAEIGRIGHVIAGEQAALDRLSEELKRARDARKTNAVTEFEVIIIERRVAEQSASVDAMRAQADVLAAQRARAVADLSAAEIDSKLRISERRVLDLSEAGVRQAEANLARAKAQRDEASLRLSRMTIASPITGYVMRRMKSPGDKVMLGGDDPRSAQILLVYDHQRIQVRTDVPLADAAHVYVGQRCEVVVEILPDRVFAGEVIRIVHEADLQKNTLQAKVRILEPSPLLRPEMLARVKFHPAGSSGGTSSNASAGSRFTAPSRWLDGRAGENATVWAVRERAGDRGVLCAVPVKVEDASDGLVRVSGDVRPTDLLALPDGGLRPGVRVRMAAYREDAP